MPNSNPTRGGTTPCKEGHGDGRLVSIIGPTGIMGRGLLRFQTLELATGLTYEHKLEPNGRAWQLGQAAPANAWAHPPPGPPW